MNKNILRFFIFLSLLTTMASCGAGRRGKQAVENKAEKASLAEVERKAFAKEYSLKLGINIPETANRSLISNISQWIGVPYKFGGKDKKGVDCSGFVSNIYLIVYNLNTPRITAQLHEKATPVERKKLREGDLVFFKINTKQVGHAGIYLFDNYFVHASTSRGVMISRLEDTYWNKYFIGGGRFSP